MNSRLIEKKEAVQEIANDAENAHSLIAAHYRGMTVTQMTELRKKGRESGVKLKIVKNTLARRALVDSQYQGLTEKLVGPMILAFSLEEPNAAAKLIKDFAKNCEALKVQAVCLENTVLGAESLDKIANMPNKPQAVAMLLGVLQAPSRNLACTLQETYAKLVRVAQAVADKRESQQ